MTGHELRRCALVEGDYSKLLFDYLDLVHHGDELCDQLYMDEKNFGINYATARKK